MEKCMLLQGYGGRAPTSSYIHVISKMSVNDETSATEPAAMNMATEMAISNNSILTNVSDKTSVTVATPLLSALTAYIFE